MKAFTFKTLEESIWKLRRFRLKQRDLFNHSMYIFFRQYKIIMRRMTDFTRSVLSQQEAEQKLKESKFIILLNVLAHNQLSADKFQPMLSYA